MRMPILHVPRDICVLVGIIFTLLAMLSGIGCLGLAVFALQVPAPAPGFGAFALNSLSMSACAVNAWWWFRQWWE